VVLEAVAEMVVLVAAVMEKEGQIMEVLVGAVPRAVPVVTEAVGGIITEPAALL
jgi:hypothetical protein